MPICEMDELPDSQRPVKRARLDGSASPQSAPLTPSKPTPEATALIPCEITPASASPARGAAATDLDREIRAGITEYVCPGNLGFSGVLKQRYSDFLVNEIGRDGRVVRLKGVGVGKGEDAKMGSKGEIEEKSTGVEGEQGRDGNDIKTENKALFKENIAGAEGAAEYQDDDENQDISDADLKTLRSVYGEDTTSGILKLVRSIRRHPEWKAKDFKAVISAPVTDKDTRTQAHRCLREIFPNMLESSMEQDQSIRIKAIPPAERGKKRKRDRNAGGGPDGRKGKLPWEEMGGEYLHFTLYKENKDTMEVIGFLGSMTKSGAKGFGFAGTKDRRACTVQRICVRRQTPQRMAQIGKQLYNAAIGDFEYQKHGLGLGDLVGNEFAITLRDCHFEKEEGLDFAQRLQLANDVLSKAVMDFAEKGFINYYGLQRFGSFTTSTDAVGMKLLKEDFKGAIEDLLIYSDDALAAANSTETDPALLVSSDDRARAKAIHIWKTTQDGNAALKIMPRKSTAERNIIQHLSSRNSRTKAYDRIKDYKGALMTIPRTLRLMYVHAYQSLVWNVVAGKRWTMFRDRVTEGDLVLVNEHKDKEEGAPEKAEDVIDQDGEIVINPTGDDSAIKDEDVFERARALTKEEAESGKYNIFDVVLPQPGFDVEYPRNAIGDFYKEFMGSERGGGLNPHKMRRSWKEISLSGAYRKLLAKPLQPLSFEIREYVKDEEQFIETDLQKILREQGGQETANGKAKDNGQKMDVAEPKQESEAAKIAVVLRLQLSSSQYATIALRELMKAGGLKAFKPEYMGGRNAWGVFIQASVRTDDMLLR
ncbi:tRNA pseudouridine synthase D [Lojkania enalia]|uniref:tRNA pseudouridine synthase D n=1 Tax=Lojkania enalia TaxID=147567 RepID=A0A9P4N7H0_9PLEO|nr:tRNA pseudouridine synthase D [Didymosphaeria enalia]